MSLEKRVERLESESPYFGLGLGQERVKELQRALGKAADVDDVLEHLTDQELLAIVGADADLLRGLP